MKQYLATIIKTLLFWLLFFSISKMVFLIIYSHLLVSVPTGEILSVFLHGLRLDISMACYLMIIPILLYCVQLCINKRIIVIFLHVIFLLELFLTSIITFAEIGIYDEWRSKLNYKALVYLRHPDEILKTATTYQVVFAIIGICVFMAGFYFIYKRIVIHPSIKPFSKKPFFKAPLVFLVMGALCFLGIRGGVDAIPIKQSSSYFSRHAILNDVAVNPHWNLMVNIIDFASLEDNTMFHFMDSQKANDIVRQLQETSKDTNSLLLKKQDINIVIILLESWSADMIEYFCKSDEIAPNFNRLAKDGLLFTNFYSNGHRSQQAICSILSGFPSVPTYDITDNHGKYKYLPSLADVLNREGYHTSFYFGGNLDYGNIRSFLLHADFQSIIEGKDIDKKLPRGKLGIHDQYMFDYHLDKLNKEQEPFFSMLFTVSSHSPYDEPKNIEPLTWDTPQLKYLNSVKYCDYWLGHYLEEAKKQTWYDNTLFILLADHSHPSHIERSYYVSDYQRIPMLWFGNVLKEEYKGTICEVVASHVDLAQTLLSQLGKDATPFRWGKNTFNPYTTPFAYFEVNKGFGWVEQGGSYTFTYPFEEHAIYYLGDTSLKKDMVLRGQAYTQKLFETYLAY